MKVLLNISFLGTKYGGWQVQKNKITVQQVLQNAVETVFGKRYPVTGCSRTDSGVHANMFCCTVEYDADAVNIPVDRIPVALSGLLPNDISVYGAYVVPDSFHPRYDSGGKEYKYLIWNGRVKNPFLSGRAMFFPRPLDEELMNAAAEKFVGKHDFSSFMAAGSKITDTVRRVDAAVVKRNGDEVMFTISGDGFLYNMVRIMTGTLIDVSIGKITLDGIPEIIEAHDRSRSGATAAACGLYLNRVFYC